MSAYRDELEAARARADALEIELAAARGEAMVQVGTAELSTLSGRASTVIERAIDGRVSDAAIERMVAEIRERVGVYGQVDALPGSVTWAATRDDESNPWALVTIRRGADSTSIRIEYQHREIVPLRRHLVRLPLYAAPLTAMVAIFCAVAGPAWSLWLIALPPLLILILLLSTRNEDRDRHAAERAKFDALATALVAHGNSRGAT